MIKNLFYAPALFIALQLGSCNIENENLKYEVKSSVVSNRLNHVENQAEHNSLRSKKVVQEFKDGNTHFSLVRLIFIDKTRKETGSKGILAQYFNALQTGKLAFTD